VPAALSAVAPVNLAAAGPPRVNAAAPALFSALASGAENLPSAKKSAAPAIPAIMPRSSFG